MHTDIARNFVLGFDIPCYLYKFLSVIQVVVKFLIRVFGNVMVTLIISFQILRLFCVTYGICVGRNFILQVHMI